MKNLLLVIVLIVTSGLTAQELPSYKIYDSKGKEVDFGKMVKTLDASEIILFGEQHNCAIAHWLQLEVTKALGEKNELILGAEMLEADNQIGVNRYLTDSIDRKGMDSTVRLWSNHDTDYAPLVDYAKEQGIHFVATNIPREYASLVHKKGGFTALDSLSEPREYASLVHKKGGFTALDSLSETEKSFIAPLPIKFDPELPQYKKILEMMGKHGSPDLVKAQAIKDATMAHFILKNFTEGSTFIHYNGAFHSNYYEGILWHLKQQQPDLRYATISTVTQINVNKLEKEYKGIADFVIVVDEDMTTTY